MIKTFLFTDKGPRADNEDSLNINENSEYLVACLADGVGGANCGKLASETVVDYFIKKVSSWDTDLRNVVSEAHQKILSIQQNHKDCIGMATTLTGCVLNSRFLKGVHVGDSRLCILRGNGIKQLTESHTEVQRLVKLQKIKFEDVETYPRRHILESAIGINGDLIIQNFDFELLRGDRLLLTSDGTHDTISKVEFRDLSKKYPKTDDFGHGIIHLLQQRKLKDNVSFIVIEIL